MELHLACVGNVLIVRRMAEGLLPYGYATFLVNGCIFVANPDDAKGDPPRLPIKNEEMMDVQRIQPPAESPDARGLFFIVINFQDCPWPQLQPLGKTMISIDIEEAANEPEVLYIAVHALFFPGNPEPWDLVMKIDVASCLRFELRQVLVHQQPHILCMRAMELVAAYAY